MRELTLYRMWRFFKNEFKRLELLKDLGAGINLSPSTRTAELVTIKNSPKVSIPSS